MKLLLCLTLFLFLTTTCRQRIQQEEIGNIDSTSIIETPKNALYYFNLGVSKSHSHANNFSNPGEMEKINAAYIKEAIESFSKAIELDPNFVDAYIKRGDINYSIGFSKQLEPEYSKTANKNSQDLMDRNRSYSSANKDYSMAITLNPNNSEAYSKRAHIKVQLHDYRGAIADYSRLIDFNPNKATAYADRAGVKVNLDVSRW